MMSDPVFPKTLLRMNLKSMTRLWGLLVIIAEDWNYSQIYYEAGSLTSTMLFQIHVTGFGLLRLCE